MQPDQLHLSFDFTLLHERWDAERMRATIDRVLSTLGPAGAPATWVFENHDVTRLPTRYGGGELGRRRARAAALLLFGLPGAAFTYQGQELGPRGGRRPRRGARGSDLPPHRRRAEGSRRLPRAAPVDDASRRRSASRDGEPWLPMPDDWARESVEAQERDPGSTLSLFRSALRLRPRGGELSWRESPRGTMIFDRGDLTCLVNVDAPELELPEGELVLASEPEIARTLPPNTAAWIRRTA